MKMRCCITFVLVMCSFISRADVVLPGYIHVGDNTWSGNNDPIKPSDLTKSVHEPKHAINFSLSEDIKLTKIIINDTNDIHYRLYFMIWGDDETILVKEWSSINNLKETDSFSENLKSGDYKIAIVGQCNGAGWTLGCNGKWDDYDDFSYSSITLISEEESKDMSFIQRRHIGDDREGNNGNGNGNGNGYGGNWYPDSPESTVVDYSFSLTSNLTLEDISINHYRNLDSGNSGETIKLSIIDGGDNVKYHQWMNQNNNGNSLTDKDYLWSIDDELPIGHYIFRIESVNPGGRNPDYDDISWDDIVIKMEENTPPPSYVNHYRIMHPNNALTCESVSTIIQACTNNSRNGSCDVATNLNDDVDVLVDGNSVVVDLTNGSGTLSGLQHFSEGSLALSFPSGTQTYCNNAIADTNSCDIIFSDIGLQFSQKIDDDVDIGNQVAGSEIQFLYLKALESDGDGTCSVLETESNDFTLGYECISPMDCDDNLNFKVGGTLLNDVTETSVSLTKTTINGVYKVHQPIYPNAGLIRLSASYVFASTGESPKTLVTDSNDFAVRPYKFEVTTANLTTPHIAGEPFDFNIAAVNKNGATTTNYIPSSLLNIKATHLIPSPAIAEGDFSYGDETIQTGSSWKPTTLNFITGGANYSTADNLGVTYSEVGEIAINVKDKYQDVDFSVDSIFDDNALGTAIGRFIPDHFALVSSSVGNYIDNIDNNQGGYDYMFPDGLNSYVAGTTVLNRGSIYQCRPEYDYSGYCGQWSTGSDQFEPGYGTDWEDAWFLLDSSSGMTYMEQPALEFNYRLEARNSLNVLTQNYNAADVTATARFVAESGADDLSKRIAEYGGVWSAGVYAPTAASVGTADDVTFNRSKDNVADGPYSLLFGIGMTDDDGVELEGMNMSEDKYDPARPLTAKRLSNTPSELRFGQWFIYDGFGPTGSAFPVTMELQYYDSLTESFVVNTDDSITTLSASDAVSTLGDLTGSGTFENGSSQKINILSDNPGTAILTYANAPEWLLPADGDEPSANIDFGFFYGNDRVIYRRRLN